MGSRFSVETASRWYQNIQSVLIGWCVFWPTKASALEDTTGRWVSGRLDPIWPQTFTSDPKGSNVYVSDWDECFGIWYSRNKKNVNHFKLLPLQVEVGGKTDWDLGIASCSVNRKGKITVSPSHGYWFLSLRDRTEYAFRTEPSTNISVTSRASRIGVYVDCDKGLLSFYNVEARILIYTFTDKFPDTIHPFFSPCTNKSGRNQAPLIICPPTVTEWVRLKVRECLRLWVKYRGTLTVFSKNQPTKNKSMSSEAWCSVGETIYFYKLLFISFCTSHYFSFLLLESFGLQHCCQSFC